GEPSAASVTVAVGAARSPHPPPPARQVRAATAQAAAQASTRPVDPAPQLCQNRIMARPYVTSEVGSPTASAAAYTASKNQPPRLGFHNRPKSRMKPYGARMS